MNCMRFWAAWCLVGTLCATPILNFGQNSILEQTILSLQINNATFYPAERVLEALPDIKLPKNELERQMQRLRLNTEELSKLISERPDQLTLALPFHGQTVLVDLYQQNILSPGFNVRTGNWQKAPYTPGAYYRGIIRGAAGSIAAVSFFDNEIIGVLAHREWGNLNLGRRETAQNTTEYVLYEERFLPIMPFADCEAVLPEKTGDVPPKTTGTPEVAGCVEQFFEADYALFQNKGTVQATVNYVTGFFNVVATIYNAEAISIALSQVFVWTTPDPYDFTSSATALNTFSDYRNNFEGDLAHLTSLEGSGLGGRAYLDVICQAGSNHAFSGINSTYQDLPTYSWTVNVVAHEMGHNMNSNHTHWCGWAGGAIDNCGPTAGYPFETPPNCTTAPTPTSGTIMSYCHLVSGIGVNLSSGFGPLPRAAMQAAVTAASSCMSASCPASTCNATTSVAASSITNNSALITWTVVAGAVSYNLQYRVAGTSAWTTLNIVTGTTQTLTGLAPSTAYDVQVQTVCSGSTVSRYSIGIAFKTIPSACAEPSGLSVAPLTNTSVTVNWTENGTATTWEIEWGAQGFTQGTGTLVNVTAKPYTLGGLAAGTAYSVYVRATCGGANGNSAWVGPVNFITPSGNDLVANALPITLGQPCVGNSFTNLNATLSASEFSPTTSNGGYWASPANQTVWFTFVAPTSGTVYINSDFSPQGSNDDTQIALYTTGTPTSVADLLVANEDGGLIGNTYNSYVYYSGLTADNTYYIQVDGWGDVEGSFCLEVHEDFETNAPTACATYTQSATTTNKWHNVYTKPNLGDVGTPVAAVRSTTSLGTVTVQEIKTSLPILSTANGVEYMQRYYAITNSQNTSAARDIRLFYTTQEFNDFKAAVTPAMPSATTEDLNISRYNVTPFNCTPTNNTGSGTLNTAVTATEIGASGYFFLQLSNAGQGEFAAVLGNTPLPAELLHFEGFMEKTANILNWETANERNIAHYALERSTNGIDQWEKIGQTAPDANQKYNLPDPAPWQNTYYRLMVADNDGTRHYSNTIYLQRELREGIKAITPNPAAEMLYVEYNTAQEQTVQFKFFAYDGRLVLEQTIELVAGNIVLPFHIENLPAGLYYCTTSAGKGLPFVKQ